MDQRFAVALRLIQKANNNQELPDFDQQALNKALKEQSGDPVAIYERLPLLEEASASIPAPVPAPIPKPARKPSPDGYYHGN
jgi:L,D-transpeptidase ErfK/SrfK